MRDVLLRSVVISWMRSLRRVAMTYPRAVIVTGKNNIKFVGLCLQNQVDFLLIGGAAAFHYGCRADGISETDIVIEPSAENSERVMSVL